MMVTLRRPSTETIREFLRTQSKLGFTYRAVGATASQPPAGYTVDHTRIKLGEGEEVFMKAKAALGRWEQFHLGCMEVWYAILAFSRPHLLMAWLGYPYIRRVQKRFGRESAANSA